jgi:hypothetical protein
MHRLRIEAKGLSYTVELFQSFYSRTPVSRFMRALTQIQDQLGELKDAVVGRCFWRRWRLEFRNPTIWKPHDAQSDPCSVGRRRELIKYRPSLARPGASSAAPHPIGQRAGRTIDYGLVPKHPMLVGEYREILDLPLGLVGLDMRLKSS